MEKKFYICLEADIESAKEIAEALRTLAIVALKGSRDEKAATLLKMVMTVNDEIAEAIEHE